MKEGTAHCTDEIGVSDDTRPWEVDSPPWNQPLHFNRLMSHFPKWVNSLRRKSLPSWLSGKESACQCRRRKRYEFNPWVRKIPWSKKCLLTAVFLPGDSMDRGAWRATIHRVTKSWTWLNTHAYIKEEIEIIYFWKSASNKGENRCVSGQINEF